MELKHGQLNGNRHKLLATEMDYLRRSLRIPRMGRIRNETIRSKNGIKERHIIGNRKTATSCEWRTAKLLDRLQNGTHRGKRGTADQSIHGRVGLGTVCKGENFKDEEWLDREL
jgi:hypothetical protein